MQFFATQLDKQDNHIIGTESQMLFTLKTEQGARKRVALYYKGKSYALYSYTNIFDETTHKEIVKHTLI